MNPSLPTLRQNLQEIWSSMSAAQPHERKELPLVSNLSGTRVYDARAGYGRLWTWFFSIAWLFYGSSLRDDRLKKAVINTHTMFQQQAQQMQETVAKYTTALSQIREGTPFDEKAYLGIKETIIEWNNSTRPFVKLMQKNIDSYTDETTHAALRSLFIKCFEKTSTTAFTSLDAQKLITCQKAIDFENHFAPYKPSLMQPVLQLVKATAIDKRAVTPDTPEGKSIEEWSKTLSASPPPLKLFRQGIDAIALLEDPDGFRKAKLAKIAPGTPVHKFLLDSGCPIYKLIDEKLAARIAAYKKGSSIQFNGKKLTIETSLQTNDDERMIHFFTLAQQPQQVLLAAKNRMILPVEHYKEKLADKSEGANLIFDRLSRKGEFIVLNGFQPMQGHVWAKNGSKIAPVDLPKAQSIAKAVQTWLGQKATPKDLLDNIYFFNGNNQLFAFTTIGIGHLDFSALEDFLIQCSAGDDDVRRYLQKASGLADHQMAAYFRMVAESAFTGKPMDLTKELFFHTGAEDPKMLKRAEQLQEEIAKGIEEQTQTMLTRYPKLNPDSAKKTEAQLLHEAYKQSEAISNLTPFLSSIAV